MFGNAHARARKRLASLSTQIAELRRKLAELDEQIGFLVQVESDAQMDSVVTDNHVATREHRAALSDLDRARRERAEVADRLDERRAEQDRLLEGLLD